MTKLEFNIHKVPSNKDLLHFVEENLDKNVLKKIGKNYSEWIEELNIIQQILENETLIMHNGGIFPDLKDPEFRKLGEKVFLYRGNTKEYKGLWIKKLDYPEGMEEFYNWSKVHLKSTATLRINKELNNISFEEFLPQNFKQKARKLKKSKRPIYLFSLADKDRVFSVFAKGAYTEFSYFYEKPRYRLTDLSRMKRFTSKKEMDISLDLIDFNIHLPKIIGYYESLAEEYLFVEKVEGKSITKCLQKKEDIIHQDAEMLANLCLAGYRKVGFTDFDDKIFDGKNLYLIDTEDCRDLYEPVSLEYKNILRNPLDKKSMEDFRNLQKDIFSVSLKDAIFNYKNNLLSGVDDKIIFIKTFYETLHWKEPTNRSIKELIKFREDYMTLDSHRSFMSDTN
ncbi:MAG: hypothetical protein ACOYT4_04855 [Nanoarchaeota archaeon]